MSVQCHSIQRLADAALLLKLSHVRIGRNGGQLAAVAGYLTIYLRCGQRGIKAKPVMRADTANSAGSGTTLLNQSHLDAVASAEITSSYECITQFPAPSFSIIMRLSTSFFAGQPASSSPY